LSISGLTKTFGGTKTLFGRTHAVLAVDNVSLDLYPGENLGIVGQSGSGKTTLGRLILRVVEPSAGSVVYRLTDGNTVDFVTLDKSGLKKFHVDVRLVFQDPFASLIPTALLIDLRPLPGGDGGDDFGSLREAVPGVAAGLDDGVIVVEDADREPVGIHRQSERERRQSARPGGWRRSSRPGDRRAEVRASP
jgi:ABC-type oligopeptide transport system ATPase subunit